MGLDPLIGKPLLETMSFSVSRNLAKELALELDETIQGLRRGEVKHRAKQYSGNSGIASTL
jgi:hypothetical protein